MSDDARFEEVLAEILQEEEAGRVPDLAAYCDRFPELAEHLRDYFRNRAGFARLARELAPTPSQNARSDTTTDDELGPAGAAHGSVAGRYQLGDEVGRGGMGAVYRACDPALGRDLAVKVLLKDTPELRA